MKIAFCFAFFLGSSEAWPPTFCGCIFFVLHFFCSCVFFASRLFIFGLLAFFCCSFAITFFKFVYDFVEQAVQQLST